LQLWYIILELNQNEFKKLQKLLELQDTKEQEKEEQKEEEKNDNFVQLYREQMPELR